MKHSWFEEYNFDDMLALKIKAPYYPKIPEIDEEHEDKLISKQLKLKDKKTSVHKDLLETCIAESRKKLIRDYQTQFDDF